MNRRSLLGFLFVAPIAAPALVKVALAEQPAVQGFGLVAEKAPAATLTYDGAVITEGAHPASLWPGIREWYAREWAEGRGIDFFPNPE